MKQHLTDQDKSDCAAFFLSSGDFHGTLEMAVRLAQDPHTRKWSEHMRSWAFETWEDEIRFAKENGFVPAVSITDEELWCVDSSANDTAVTVTSLRGNPLYRGQNPSEYEFPVFTKANV